MFNVFRFSSNVFINIAKPNKFKLWKINGRKTVQTQSVEQLNENGKLIRKSFYKEPAFYRYFNQFLVENNLIKYVSDELKFHYQHKLDEFLEIDGIIAEENTNDDGFIALARSESLSLIEQLIQLQDQILNQACVDDHDINECSFEIRAGVGGKEASLFAQELYSLYLKFITFNGWQIRTNQEDFEQIELDDSSSLFTQTIEINGNGCYPLLRHEAGVHRVQRVPQTEKYGRIHTSTVSIAVIPVRHNLVTVKESDLKIEMKTSSGPGGQNVNRNLTCVRITHLPTGHTVESQETRFQYLNKEIALRKLKTLLNQIEYERLEREARQRKRSQVGIAARSDKIRTYNFPQNRITDHRLIGHNNNLHNIDGYMNGNECDKMRQIIDQLELLRHEELRRQLRDMLEKNFVKSSLL
ncbi:peptide chain release factor 1-like protein, mitochondrial-like [Euroglyphus maynei]|uniref:Peptide chain release factor 1-like protein, mitochondrial-like n=1 Tax=Euroglyphus maynei TaxID=6958 RepID=A0A1Y3BD32_EURMA|nr:peptide chain release factor 1-like protein, mitochondrial-like [Euroglyphus maynei]